MTLDEFMKITGFLSAVLRGTKFEGHVYAVGGSVRDYVMSMPIKDVDLVVDMPNGGIELAQHLYENKYLLYEPVIYPTYGTCQFRLCAFPNDELEAVHTRSEQYHDKNSRNPETAFGSIFEDAVRRDLTINALYYDIFSCKIVDPTGNGLDDIKNRMIRTSNENPDVVFDDDPLRILRVIRFASRYGWIISTATSNSIKKYISRLSIISRERITAEFTKMLMCKHPAMAMNMLFDYGLMETVLGVREYNRYTHRYHIVPALRSCATMDADIIIRLAVMYYYLHYSEVSKVLHDIKLPNNVSESVSKIVEHLHDFESDTSDKNIRKVQLLFGEDLFRSLLGTIGALDIYDIIPVINRTDSHHCHMFDYKLPVNGFDIMNTYGIGGKQIGDVLSRMMDAACENPNITKDELLIMFKDYSEK